MRIVMFVANPVTHDARVLREARTLADAGHEVTVVGRPQAGRPQTAEERRGAVRILRVAGPSTPLRRWRALRFYPWSLLRELLRDAGRFLREHPRNPGAALLAGAGVLALLPWTLLRGGYRLLRGPRPAPAPDALDWIMTWRLAVGTWADSAAAAAPDADAWHGHDLSGMLAGIRAQRQRGGRLVFDAHELLLESRTSMRRPRWARGIVARAERTAFRRADALVTVNPAIAGELASRYGQARQLAIVHNAPPLPVTPPRRPGPLRAAIGIDSSTPLLLYHGGFSAERGIEELLAAGREASLADVHLAFLGYGELQAWLEAQAAAPEFGGRIHVLPAVEPDVLLDWVSDADLGVMAIQSTTLNHRLATPNKLFECLAAGTPVVAGDLPGMRAIVLGDPAGPLGAVCDPADPGAIAASAARLLALEPTARDELRTRCVRAARERWNWETEGAKLVALYASLEGAPGSSSSAPGSATT